MKKLELRESLALEAARLMYEEGVEQYFDAKRLAAKRLFGGQGEKNMRYRPQDLPSNGEIQAALRQIVQYSEGELNQVRLFVMRVIAFETMNALIPFKPRLIGSVSTGHVRKGSDIDLHVFTESLEDIETYIEQLGWRFKTKQVTVRVSNDYKDYSHIHCKRIFPIELSIYSYDDIRVTQRSSTDGKPIIRLKPAALERLMNEQHHSEWENYLATGEIEGIDLFQ
ncbi:MAG: hypothetical protein KAH77_04150 [Thiomargarita sp.]|nr:hypothetical protein [Thiomargarita sp.]